MRSALALFLVVPFVALSGPSHAHATCFCMMRAPPPPTHQQRGIAEDPSYNPASAVVLVREGRRTVLTIEAAYQGPAVELSLVVPVPGPVGRENVRTVSGTAFRRLDQRTAPRVRHVFRPCPMPPMRPRAAAAGDGMSTPGSSARRSEAQRAMDELGVDIQDEWPVDEYDVTLLGAEQSNGLLAFLRERGLELPDASAAMLRGYIESGHRFVLFRADPSRAQRLGENMMLSPIQIEYESDELRVPVRLGTLNSPGEQELLLYVISTEGRHDVANRPTTPAATDIRMRRDARGTFAELYAAVTDETFRRNPGAAITEYAHPIGTHVRWSDVAPFGVTRASTTSHPGHLGRRGAGPSATWTVSRIRHRYGTDLADDLTLRQAEPLTLTRRWTRWPQLRVRPRAGQSAFHVQYVVEHDQCMDEAAQRRLVRRFATAESMWESRHDLWPGQVILDPIESLGIAPGSSAPTGWPPAPAARNTPDTRAAGTAMPTSVEATTRLAQPTPVTTPSVVAPSTAPATGAPTASPARLNAPAARTGASTGGCAARTTSARPLLASSALLLFFGLALARRRRRVPGPR